MARQASIAVAGELLVNAFNLLSQVLIVGLTPASALWVWLVVIAAGGEPSYLAGFRNWSQFLAVITDESALFFC
jgi:hypothetical protein